MGPVPKSGAQDRAPVFPRKPDEAPPLYPGADRFRWRRQVAAWVSYIQRRAEAGDKICKSHAATLSDLLYAAVHPSYQKVLELAKSASLDFSVSTEKQPEVVQEIVRLIGFESPIEATSRLLTAYKAVHACTRYPNESLDKFTVRYRGVASHYMDLANVSCNSQDSQLLAMVLLENAQLTPDTLQGAKLQLVHQAQQREKLGVVNNVNSEFTQCINKCGQLLAKLPIEPPDTLPDSDVTVTDSVTLTRSDFVEVITCLEEIKTTLQEKTAGHDHDKVPDRPHPIYLDDAVLVLQTMTSSVAARIPQTHADVPVPALFGSSTTIINPAGSNSTVPHQQQQPVNADSLAQVKKRTRCHACHRYGHWKGDPPCAKKHKTSDGSRHQPQPHDQDEIQPKGNKDGKQGF